MPMPCSTNSSVISRRIKSSVISIYSGALIFACLAQAAAALTITEIGTSGIPGIDRPLPSRGGNGGAANAGAVSSDYVNTVTATAGSGGEGGSSTVLLPGAAGGKGGNATANLTAQGQIFEEGGPFLVHLINIVSASGGAGGDGGSGLIPGNGGAGGSAFAKGIETGAVDLEFYPEISDQLTVNASGGDGGRGLNGGAGGAAKASAIHSPTHPIGSASGMARAQAGNGGDGLLLGGRGGNASATVTADLGGFPADTFEDAIAIGGSGGTSAIGLHGNGGDARAVADGSFSARDLGMQVTARATGGDSGGGTGFALRGKGGNAFATAKGESLHVAFAYPQAFAQGGAGAVRGGDAVAYAEGFSGIMGGGASATATGGTGPRAGVALATTVSENSWLSNSATATANYSGPITRSVAASGATFALESGSVVSRIFAQASAGNTSAYAAPQPENATLTVRGIGAPSAAVTNAALASNSTIANTLQGGTVLGLGEFGTNVADSYDSINGTISYVFDTAGLQADHLWLGLLDSDLPDNTFGTFNFLVTGEGQTLFERDFSGNDFLDFFNDRAFDLGNWASLVSVDGLFDLNVSFSGYVPGIDFLIGAADGPAAQNVPEPSSLLMLMGGLLGLLLMRNIHPRRTFSRVC